MKIKVDNKSKNQLPKYAAEANAGIDLQAIFNSPGSIDTDYRGGVCVILMNLSSESIVIKDRERIYQMVIAKHEMAEWINVDNLLDTEREVGGFGHTGKR